MKRQLSVSVFLAVVAVFVMGSASSALAAHEIVGAPKCKICHKSKTGDQWGKWLASKHSKAYDALGTDLARKLGAERGVEDPQKDPACLKCHTTQGFHGADVAVSAKGKYKVSEGVGCEVCHGPGSDYRKKKIMKDLDAAKAAGLQLHKEEAFCKKCHNEESPSYKEFVFEERWAKIAHPRPKK